MDQLETVMGMGSLSELASMMPGIDAKALEDADPNNNVMRRTRAIIQSMTVQERENPDLLNASRKRRIAKGAGVSVVDVNRVLKQYDAMLQMMKQMNGAGKRQMKKMTKQAKKSKQKKGGKQQPQQQAMKMPKGFGGLGNLFK